jgi:hypothetical protein
MWDNTRLVVRTITDWVQAHRATSAAEGLSVTESAN